MNIRELKKLIAEKGTRINLLLNLFDHNAQVFNTAVYISLSPHVPTHLELRRKTEFKFDTQKELPKQIFTDKLEVRHLPFNFIFVHDPPQQKSLLADCALQKSTARHEEHKILINFQ